jgi:hypothetical protein
MGKTASRAIAATAELPRFAGNEKLQMVRAYDGSFDLHLPASRSDNKAAGSLILDGRGDD